MDEGWQKYLESIDKRLGTIEGKVDTMIEFKWQIIGGSVVLSLILGIAVQILVAKIGAT